MLDLPLEFDLDADDDGLFTVSASYEIDGVRYEADLNELSRYGYSVAVGDEVYVLNIDDVSIVQALKALNPQRNDRGGRSKSTPQF